MSQDQDKHVAAGDDRKDAWRGQDKGFAGVKTARDSHLMTLMTMLICRRSTESVAVTSSLQRQDMYSWLCSLSRRLWP